MSNIKSKGFYTEAENMSPGWGEYMKAIDVLKNAANKHKDITLNDACWILYSKGHCSSVWVDFQEYCNKKRWGKRTMPWEAWQGLFNGFILDTEINQNKMRCKHKDKIK